MAWQLRDQVRPNATNRQLRRNAIELELDFQRSRYNYWKSYHKPSMAPRVLHDATTEAERQAKQSNENRGRNGRVAILDTPFTPLLCQAII